MLTKPLRDLMNANLLVRSVTEEIQAVSPSIQADTTLVIMDSTGYPIGLLTADLLATVSPQAVILADLHDVFLLPTVSHPDTQVAAALEGMRIDAAVRWYVIYEEGKILGVLPPYLLFQEIDNGRSKDALSAIGLHGDPVLTSVQLCYRCSGAGVPHRLNRNTIVRSISGLPLCPHHANLRVIPENPCQGDEDAC